MGTYIRLVDYNSQQAKEDAFLSGSHRYVADSSIFTKIPGMPIAYWVSEKLISAFNSKKIEYYGKPRQGLATGENMRFTRMWYEPNINNTCMNAKNREDAVALNKKWFPYNKGGEFRKWYGNNDCIVNWENDGDEIRNFKDLTGSLRSRPQNMEHYFRQSITWSKISSGSIAFRYKPFGHIFDVAGTSIFANEDILFYLLGFCNSKVALKIANILSPTLNYEVGHIASFPVVVSEIYKNNAEISVAENIAISKTDWDSFEASWDFIKHPLV